MYTLANDQLAVDVLDPVVDRARLGARYCTGGYVFQVTDHRLGPLLAGPTYPDAFEVFHGQGIPDAFNLNPLRGPDPLDPVGLIIGIGTCQLAEGRVLDFCSWQVDAGPHQVCLNTEQRFHNYALRLERRVTLIERTVRTEIRLVNLGSGFIALRWFPHPFFPQPGTDELFRVNFPVTLSPDPGFELSANGYVRRRDWPWPAAQAKLNHAGDTRLIVMQRHPVVGLVTASCSFAPDFFLIWGNAHAFSWEPFIERSLLDGQDYAWSIDYDF